MKHLRAHLFLAVGLVLVLAAATVACGSIGPRSGESQFTNAAPAPGAPVPISSAPSYTPTPPRTWPMEVQVYISTAQGLVDSGAVPEEAVTADGVQTDLIDNYGLHVDDADAAAIVEEILR